MEKSKRKIFLFWLGVLCASCGTGDKRTSDGHIDCLSVFVIRNKVVQDSVRSYYQNYLHDNLKGVVTVSIRQGGDTTSFLISSIVSRFGLETNMPLLYSEVDNLPVLINTNLEKELGLNVDQIKLIESRLYPVLEYAPLAYNPPAWNIQVVATKIVSVEVVN